MHRGAKPGKAKVDAKLPVASNLEKRLAEALEQQTATVEVLRVISSSPTNVQPVFDTIASSAVRLCGARIATVFHFDGELQSDFESQRCPRRGRSGWRDLELSHGHSRAVAYQNDFTLGQSICPQIHHNPQHEILTSRRGVAAGGGVRAA